MMHRAWVAGAGLGLGLNANFLRWWDSRRSCVWCKCQYAWVYILDAQTFYIFMFLLHTRNHHHVGLSVTQSAR